IGTMQPGNSHAVAFLVAVRSGSRFVNGSDHLVARYDWQLARPQLAFNDVQIGSTDCACVHLHAYLAGSRFRSGNVSARERVRLNGRVRANDASSHAIRLAN